MSSSRCRRVAAVAAVLLALAVAGCSGGTVGTPHETEVTASRVSGKPTVKGTRIDVHVTTNGVHPTGKQITAHTGAPVTFVVHGVAAGELHVHSSPEQRVVYPRGLSTAILRFDRPGVVDVESHQFDELVVRLEIR